MNTSVSEAMNCMETMIYFLLCFIRILLLRIVEGSKIYQEHKVKLEEDIDNQSIMIKSLESENKLLKVKESKFKLALDNLLERSEKQRKEIHDLKAAIDELEETNSYSELHIANLKAESKRKGRELVRMQIKLDILNCTLLNSRFPPVEL